MKKDISKYDHLLDRPHPVSQKHTPMSMESRAAQFAPFAALTGYDAAVQETARLTRERILLDEEQRIRLDERFSYLMEHILENPYIRVIYFVPDPRKNGGSYETAEGQLLKVDLSGRFLIYTDERIIPIDEIISIDGDLFHSFEF